MGNRGDRRIRPTRGRATVATHRARRRALSTAAMLVMVGALAGPVVPTTLSPAAGAGPACTTAQLKPELHETMVSQGLPSYSALVRGKDTLVRLFLHKPACASKTQAVTVTGVNVGLTNGATPLGSASLFSPTGPFALPASYTGTAPPNTPTDPILTVKGNVLTPCGAQASCPTDTAGFSATFNITLTYTATGVTGSQTITFPAVTKPVAQKSNALRLLVVPMGDARQLSSSQYSAAADAAVQQGMNTLSRILPVPCNADPTDPTGACFATSLLSPFGGVRYSVSPGTVDLSAVPGAYDSSGKFCGTQSNFDAIKGTLAQFLQAWNTENPSNSADRVIGVVDEAISSGVGTSPTGWSCADGMAATGSVAAWVRAMYSTQPSRTGGLLAMEVTHTFGGVRYPRSTTTHSPNSSADGSALGRAYDLIRRAYIPTSRSAMKYDTTSPWDNTTTLFEQLDQEFLLCHLGGPPNAECATSGTTGAITGAGATNTVVMTYKTGYTAATTEYLGSGLQGGVARPQFPDPIGPTPDGPIVVVGDGPVPLKLNFAKASSHSDHSHEHNNEQTIHNRDLLSVRFEAALGQTEFRLYVCGDNAQSCKDDPVGNGGVLLDEVHQLPSKTTVSNLTAVGAGQGQNWTQDSTRVDTNPAVNSGSVAWVARCSSCSNDATTIHVAPQSDRTKFVEMPLSSGISHSDPAWNKDGTAVAYVAGGNINKGTVNRSTVPYTVSGVTTIYAQGGSNPAAAYPTWSPDGTKICFSATNGGIRCVSVNGGKSSPLFGTSANESQPSGGPNNLMAYTKKAGSGGGTDIWTVDPNRPQSTQRLAVTNGDQPWFGADGKILFRRAGKIMSVLPDGTGLEQVSSGPDDQNGTSFGSTLGLDQPFGSDREVVLANLDATTYQGRFTGPLGSHHRSYLSLTCSDGADHVLDPDVPIERVSDTVGTASVTLDDSRARGGNCTVQFKGSDGWDPFVQGPSSAITITSTNKPTIASITSPSSTTICPKCTIAANGSATDPDDNASLRWFVGGTFVGTGNRLDIPSPANGWQNGQLPVLLEATATNGQVDTDLVYLTVDGVAPTITSSGPVVSSSTMTWSYTFTDTGGSSSYTQFGQLDTGEKVPVTSPVTYEGLASGEHTATICVTDEAGNETCVSHDFVVDVTPPTTEATLTPPLNANGWSNTDVTVTLAATDSSGVQSVTYSLSGAQTGGGTLPGGSASVTVTAEGETTISYYATDNAAQVEPTKQILVRIDKGSPPQPTITKTPSALGIPNTCITLIGGCTYEGTASDSLSGVAAVILHFDGGLSGSFDEVAFCAGCSAGAGTKTWSFTPAPLQLLLGNYTVTAIVIDRAGNVSAPSAANALHVI